MKPQDILVTLKLFASSWPGTFEELAKQLGMSASAVHAALKRARTAGLIDPIDPVPNKTALAEFLLHGLRYVFPAQQGSLTRGIPTGHGAPPLRDGFTPSSSASSEGREIPVWPDPDGTERGYALTPLCRSAPAAARRDPALYEWLVLADALRAGRARERELAAKIVCRRLGVT